MPSLERDELVDALLSKGFQREHATKHDKFFYVAQNGKRLPICTHLSRGSQYKTLGKPYVSKIARQLKLSGSELEDLAACPFTAEMYAKKLAELSLLPKQASPVSPTASLSAPEQRKLLAVLKEFAPPNGDEAALYWETYGRLDSGTADDSDADQVRYLEQRLSDNSGPTES